MSKKELINEDMENIKAFIELYNHSNNCNDYIRELINSIKKVFMLNKIDRYDYERQINLLTVIQLELEYIAKRSRENSNKMVGGIIDVTA